MDERMDNAGAFAPFFKTALPQASLTGLRPPFSEKEIKQARAKHNLVSLIGAQVALTQLGMEWVGLCPFHHEKIVPTLSVVPEKGVYLCRSCGACGDALTWLMQTENISFRQAVEISLKKPVALPVQKQQAIRAALEAASPPPSDAFNKQRKFALARRLWDESHPATGTLVERYLFTRGLLFDGAVPDVFRFHPKLMHEPSHQCFPAMVSAVQHPDGQLAGIHRTYLAPDGNGLAEVSVGGVRRMLGECFGGHVHLGAGSLDRIAIATGIEIALTVAQACPDLTVWACMSIGNLKAAVPSTVSEVILCVDSNNRDPHMAERMLAEAAREHEARGQKVRIARSPQGMDFNDVILAGQAD